MWLGGEWGQQQDRAGIIWGGLSHDGDAGSPSCCLCRPAVISNESVWGGLAPVTGGVVAGMKGMK